MTTTAIRPATSRSNNGQHADVGDVIPPHNIEAEEATIGSCLIDPEAIEPIAAVFGEEVAPFFIVKNQWVWDAIVTLTQRGDPVDFVTLTHELTARGQIDELGGPAYISHLINVVPTAMHAEGYARIVAGHAMRRRMLETASSIAEAAYDESDLAIVILDRAQHNLDMLRRSREIGASSQLRFFQATQAFEQTPPVDYVVDGLIQAGVPTVLVAKEKLGKSYISLDMGICVAAGLPWLGRKTKRCGVAYFDEENGEPEMRRRVASTMRGHDLESHDLPLFVFPMPRLNFRAGTDVRAVIDLIQAHDIGLCIGDSWIDMLTIVGAKEKDSDDQQGVLMRIQDIGKATGAAFILQHHENRGGEYRGSSALPGAVDAKINVKKAGDLLNFELELTRVGTPCKFSARMNFGPGTFCLSPTEFQADTAPHFSKSQEFVMRYLQQHGASKIGDIKAGADTCSPDAARAAVYSLAHNGLVYRTNPGKRGEEALYDRAGIDLNEL